MSQVALFAALCAAAFPSESGPKLEPAASLQDRPSLPQPLGNPFQVQFGQSLAGRRVQILLDGWIVKASQAGKLVFRDARGVGVSVCADVRAPIARGMSFMVRPFRSSEFGGAIAKAGRIVARHFREAQSTDQCAGLQLAVWEAVEDGGPRAGFREGKFQAHADASVIAYAEAYYRAIGTEGDALFLQTGPGACDGNQGQGSGQNQITTL